MHYKLVVTDEMDRLLDERVGYLMKEFKSNQAASHLLDGIEGLFHSLENYSRKMQLIWGDNWS